MSRLSVKHWGIAHPYGEAFDIEKGPPDTTNFCLDLRIDVQQPESEAVTNYQIFVCSPSGLAANFSDIADHIAIYGGGTRSYILGKGILILREYDIKLIEEAAINNIETLVTYAIDLS